MDIINGLFEGSDNAAEAPEEESQIGENSQTGEAPESEVPAEETPAEPADAAEVTEGAVPGAA